MKSFSLILAATMIFIHCKSHQPANQALPAHDTNPAGNDFISGQVTSMQQGKDGYTAQITTTGKLLYYATVSRSNLKDPAQYKTVVVGDSISVTGDAWKMQNENHITVREIK